MAWSACYIKNRPNWLIVMINKKHQHSTNELTYADAPSQISCW